MAGTLDRAAQSSTDPEAGGGTGRRPSSCSIGSSSKTRPAARAASAVSSGTLSLGAGAKLDRRESAGPERSSDRAIRRAGALDNAIERFRAVAGEGNSPTLADNLRFRLAEALADRADLDPAASSGRRTRESEALDLLDQAPTEVGLAGYWHLLKADLLRRSAKPAEAEKEIAAAVKSTPAPPPREVVEVNVPLLLDQRKDWRRDQVARVVADREGDPGTLDGADSPGRAKWATGRCRAVQGRDRLVSLGQRAAGREVSERGLVLLDLARASCRARCQTTGRSLGCDG